ncbi:MAG TPA: hypothetical protein VLJ37_03020 [bacterium]|nr:hypothetical protein [bacterium]
MSTSLRFPALMDSTLPFQGQQARILELITSGLLSPTERLEGGTLNLSFNEPPNINRVPLTEELTGLEDAIVAHLGDIIPPETEPRMLLFGPGPSMTDPLYALRFLAKLAAQAGSPAEMTAYDLYDRPDVRRYYAGLPLGPNRARLEMGPGGNYKHLNGAGAHLILAIHPGMDFETLFETFARNLVRGGIGVMQASVLYEFSADDDYTVLVNLVAECFRDTFEYFLPPLRSRLFRSYFSERSNDVHVLTVRRN